MFTLSLCSLLIAPAAEPPSFVVANPALKLTVYPPDPTDGFYRGTRFEWSGVVGRAEFGGHRFFEYWKDARDPGNHDDVPGTAEEFSLPVGYDAAKPGETFLKVGVGLLEKPDDKPYQFARRYKFAKVGTWSVKRADRMAEFAQELAHPAGYAYRYVKVLEIDAERPTFTIRRTLTNTGPKRLETNHYGHHFTRVDGDPVGPDYEVQFAFEPKPKDPARLNGLAEFRGQTLRFLKPLGKSSVFAEIDGWPNDASGNRFTLVHLKTGYAVKATGDRPLSKFNFWSVTTACCPEPYVDLKLAPGASITWSTKYEFLQSR
ncbi:MAG: hypothetical protein U0746_09290 [Gemmataceae bacterium]